MATLKAFWSFLSNYFISQFFLHVVKTQSEGLQKELNSERFTLILEERERERFLF